MSHTIRWGTLGGFRESTRGQPPQPPHCTIACQSTLLSSPCRATPCVLRTHSPMAREIPERVPRNKPKTLRKFLEVAARAFFPKNNERRMLKVLSLFLERQASGKWVTRDELWSFWDGRSPKSCDGMERHRVSNSITNGLEQFRGYLALLSWTVPHFHLEFIEARQTSETKYHLNISRRGEPWDFTDEEIPHADTPEFSYSFTRSNFVHKISAQVWRAEQPHHQLDIVAERASAKATWRPPAYADKYDALRDKFFQDAAAQFEKENMRRLHPGELWGIRELHSDHVDGASTIRLITTRISYADNLYVRKNYDATFPPLKKAKSIREWLGMDHMIDDRFCPPRDALCVSVALVSKKRGSFVYVARQKSTNGTTKWELSAQGAASSSHLVAAEESPDIKAQARTVTFRETGIRFEPDEIEWLAFARSRRNGDSSVLALVELDMTPADVARQFAKRRETDDIEELCPVPVKDIPAWLRSIPPSQRGELLELSLALVAIRCGIAKTVAGPA